MPLCIYGSEEPMKNCRYGKFRFSDYWISWIGIMIMTLFSVLFLILDPSIISVFPMACAAVWLWSIVWPHCEQFIFSNDSITVFKGKKKFDINLPPEVTIVVSRADIAPLFSVRTATREQTHVLSDKYAVSILQKMPTETVLESLHRNHLRTYSMSTIRNSFDDTRFIYSFACNQSLLNRILENRKCSMIIPQSLLEEISINTSVVDVYIDTCC